MNLWVSETFSEMPGFSAPAKKQRAMHSTLKVILDQLALASLYVSAGTKATGMNSFFILSLCVLCLCQAFDVCRRRKATMFLWTIVLVYSTTLLVVTCTGCRAIQGILWHCNVQRIGLNAAKGVDVVFYTATLVLSAVQVHFTWSASQNDSENEEALLDDFRSPFRQFTRKCFLVLACLSLLAYPLGYPANLVSYGYVLFLALSILVELLGPSLRRDNPSVHPLIRSYWLTVVLVATLAVSGSFSFIRVPGLQWMGFSNGCFGFNRHVSNFRFTVGDTSVLIIVSLQGMFWH